MAWQDAEQQAREVGGQAEEKVSQLADAGAANAAELADQASEQLDSAQKSAQDTAASAQDKAQEAQAQAEELLNQAPDQLQQFAEDAQQQARAMTDSGLERFRAAAQKASTGVDQATRMAGGTLRGAASNVRQYTPESGAAANITERLASGLEYTGSYLESQSDGGIIRAAIDFLRRRPILAGLAGASIGFLLLRRLRRGR
jgi:ElaB/YqjD/DUF883 family membrane-anchored ribosome-binding protein